MLDADVIEPATPEWASPIVLVPKTNGSLRFCVDYCRLNANTVSDEYPLPRIDDFPDSLCDARIFTILESNAGYWQVPVAPEDRDKTTSPSHLERIDIIACHLDYETCPRPFNVQSISS